jgi:hypothetical protein
MDDTWYLTCQPSRFMPLRGRLSSTGRRQASCEGVFTRSSPLALQAFRPHDHREVSRLDGHGYCTRGRCGGAEERCGRPSPCATRCARAGTVHVRPLVTRSYDGDQPLHAARPSGTEPALLGGRETARMPGSWTSVDRPGWMTAAEFRATEWITGRIPGARDMSVPSNEPHLITTGPLGSLVLGVLIIGVEDDLDCDVSFDDFGADRIASDAGAGASARGGP